MDEHRRALDLAFRSVAARERTEQELRQLLAKRGYEPDVVDDVVGALRDDGLIDDAGYARRFAEDRRLIDRWGSERIARDLARRGVDRELIEGAVGGVGHAEELELAVALLDRRFPMAFAGDRDRDKAWRMLVRRGYEPELAYEAVRRHEQGLGRAA
jgi:regulatory protein